FARLPFLFGGWPLSAYIYYLTWRNFSIIFLEYRFYAILYLGIFTIISLAVCYRMGPPEDERSLNLMEWSLQIIALALIYFFNQSRIYTRMELENLRQFCNSQNSKTNWQLVSRLKRPNRMASFITGDSDHVSAMEFSYHSEIYCQNEGSDEENSYLEEGYITDDD
uniref:Transmembrane protein n=1 Tax=Meloidogyne javanica TaxID=6303 RepID=A0A915LHY7_MELJA